MTKNSTKFDLSSPMLGYSSLLNLGNTCFMNSGIQLLRSLPLMNYFFEYLNQNRKIIKQIPETILLNEFNELRMMMMSQNVVISPKKFVHYLKQVAIHKKNRLFSGMEQNDISEFIMFMIECFHDSISRSAEFRRPTSTDGQDMACYDMLTEMYKKEYSEIIDIFYGVTVSEILSVDGAVLHSVKPEQFCFLDLELPYGASSATLYDCFEEFTCHEILDGDNAWFNEKTGKREDIQKRIRFWRLPNVLMITLKRFSYDGSKNNCFVDFPLNNLDLSDYLCSISVSPIYQLTGVCYHHGNAGGGHYTAIVKDHLDQWIHYNDNLMQLVGPKAVINPSAYCLMYCRVT